jgi:hypothetical protein
MIQWALVPAAFVVACKDAPSAARRSMSDDLKKDLQLASVTQNLHISPDEIAPKSHQELAVKPKKAPNGPKVIRDEHPTLKASVKPVDAAPIKAEVPQVQVMASAPAPSETPTSDAPPLARPSPVPQASYPGAAPIPGNGGSGGVMGGIWGAVIRGGGVGDDDHCDPRGPITRRPGRPIGGDIYGPAGSMGGVIRTGIPSRGHPRF